MNAYAALALAITAEIIATSALKMAHGFSRFIPSIVVVVGYGATFFFLSLTLRSIPIGVAYAIWSGVGIAVITLIGWLFFKQSLDFAAVLGIGLIIVGVIILNFFSHASSE